MNAPPPGFFITGTDTGVGKTLATVAMTLALRQLGHRVAVMKPVAAGAEQHDGAWVNDDVAQLLAVASGSYPAAEVNPYLFREPIAPHIAAEHKGVRIELARIVESFEALSAGSDIVLVEGAGGFLVPLGPSLDGGDLARALALPVILVVGMRLGCLNHALLSAEAIARRGLVLAGWIGNHIDPDMAAYDENLASLTARLPAPLIAEFPRWARADTAQAARCFSPRLLQTLSTHVLRTA